MIRLYTMVVLFSFSISVVENVWYGQPIPCWMHLVNGLFGTCLAFGIEMLLTAVKE